MDLAAALAYLDGHVNLELSTAPAAAARRLDGVRSLVEVLGDPQDAYPVVHLTGTNGKGSTARILTSVLAAKGLSVGTYTSPHLERVNERLSWCGQPISDGALAEVVEAVALAETMLPEAPTYFELLTAAAFRWFADVAVDVAVVEVGLGGRWDATNVADATVAVVTNVSLDHADIIGPTLTDIATEKAGIVKPGSLLVLGETDPDLAEIFRAAPAAGRWTREADFACAGNQPAHGGRLLDLRTPAATYDDVYLPVHGAHQGENASLALAAAEAFFAEPIHPDVVTEAFAAVTLPGRMEVVARRPLVLLDGAHNPAGAAALASAVDEEFDTGPRVLVVGMLMGRDPGEMLAALDVARARLVVACTPRSPRALPAEDVAAAARAAGVAVRVVPNVASAARQALQAAGPDDQVLVTGSLYVVGAARPVLRRAAG